MTICQPKSAFRLLPMAICLNKPEKSPYSLAIVSLIIMLQVRKMYVTELSQAKNSPSVPTAVGKCKISIEKNKKK